MYPSPLCSFHWLAPVNKWHPAHLSSMLYKMLGLTTVYLCTQGLLAVYDVSMSLLPTLHNLGSRVSETYLTLCSIKSRCLLHCSLQGTSGACMKLRVCFLNDWSFSKISNCQIQSHTTDLLSCYSNMSPALRPKRLFQESTSCQVKNSSFKCMTEFGLLSFIRLPPP